MAEGTAGSKRALVALTLALGLFGSFPAVASSDDPAPAPIIATIAGSADPADLPALDLGMDPVAVAPSPHGVYLADLDHHVVRELDQRSGSARVVAGTGQRGDAGDGGPATAAQLEYPRGLATAPDGSLFIGTSWGIRRVAPDGTIGTVAELLGVGALAISDRGVLFAEANGIIHRVHADGTSTVVAGAGSLHDPADGTPAADVNFFLVGGLAAVDDQTLLVGDPYAAKVFRIDVGGAVTTFAGRTDEDCARDDGVCGSFSGDGGPATAADLRGPNGVAVAADGSVVIADTSNHRIRHVDPSGIITTLAGTGHQGGAGDGGPAALARLEYPYAVTTVADGMYLTARGAVRSVDAVGTISRVAGTGFSRFGGDGHEATSAQLELPTDVAAMADGSLLVVDAGNHRVRRIAPDGTISTFAGNGRGPWDRPECCEWVGAGDGGPATEAELLYPIGIAVAPDGSVYISEEHRIRRVDPQGIITTFAGSTPGSGGDGGLATSAQVGSPAGLAVTSDGGLLIAEPYPAKVRKVLPDGTITTVVSEALGHAVTNAFDVAEGPDGSIYVAQGGTVARLRPDGAFERLPGAAPSTAPTSPRPELRYVRVSAASVALDDEGRVYLSRDRDVQRRDRDGHWRVVAGNGDWGYSGDGGPATAARLTYPSGLAFHGGALVIADRGNDRVRAVPVTPDTSTPDVTPPAVTASTGAAPDHWHSASVEVRLEAHDDSGAVLDIEWTLANENESQTSGVIAGPLGFVRVVSSGRNELRFRARDTAGNTSSWESLPVLIDTHYPEAGLIVTPQLALDDAPDVSTGFELSATCADVDSGCARVELKVDGYDVENPTMLDTEGPHRIVAVGWDHVGRQSVTDERIVRVDRTGPLLEASRAGFDEGDDSRGWSRSGWRIRAGCWDAVFGDGCTSTFDLDSHGAAPLPNEGVAVEAEGRHHVLVESRDRLGNASQQLVEAFLDRTAPSGRLLTGGVSVGRTHLEAQLADARLADGTEGSGVHRACFDTYAVNGGVGLYQGCIPATLTPDGRWRADWALGRGAYRVVVTGQDVAGNAFSSPASIVTVVAA